MSGLAPPLCYIHVGAPKTGTTAIQYFLMHNAAALREANAHYPIAGRCSWRPGHHDLTAQLRVAFTAGARNAALSDVLDEIVRVAPRRAIISAEDLAYVDGTGAALRMLRAALSSIGYDSKAIFYVRAHSDYVESIYCEAVKLGYREPFDAYLRQVFQDGTMSFDGFSYPLTFETFARQLVAVFGRSNVCVRAYVADTRIALLRDFCDAIEIGGEMNNALLAYSQAPANPRLTTGAIMLALGAASPAGPGQSEASNMPFQPLGTGQRQDVAKRFAADARYFVDEWGIDGKIFSGALSQRFE